MTKVYFEDTDGFLPNYLLSAARIRDIVNGVAGLNADTLDNLDSTAFLLASKLGAAPGVASLGSDGKVPSGQLPTPPVSSVNSKTGAVVLSSADVGAIPATDKGATNGVAELVGGLLPTSRLPALAINDTFPIASQAAMLALTAQRGDVAVRTDLSQTYILAQEPASTLSNWTLLPTPPDAVSSVNGQTGVVNLSAANVGAKPSSYVPAWAELTGKPSVYPPDIGSTAAQAIAGNDARVVNAEQTTNKNIAGGYAGLNASTVVPPQYLATGARDGTKFLRDDGTYAVPASAGGGYATVQDEGTGLAARPVLDFVGAGVAATDDGPNGRTVVTVPGNSHASDTVEGINYMDVAPASATNPVALGQNSPVFASHVYGLTVAWNSATSITVSSGSAYVPGLNRMLNVPNAITLSGLALAASSWRYVYLKGDGTLAVVATAPTTYKGTAKTDGTNGWRYLGALRTDASGNVYQFVSVGNLVKWLIGSPTAAPQRVVSGGAATANATVSLAALVPPSATLARLRVATNANSAAYFGPAGGPDMVQCPAAAGYEADLAMDGSQQVFYRNASASGGVYVDAYGYWEAR